MRLIQTCASMILATTVLAISPPAEAQGATLRIESILGATHASSKAVAIFKDEVARLSEGSINVEILAGSPRSFKDAVDSVHAGSIFGTWGSVGYFSRLVPEIEAISLPFVFKNYDEARRAIASPAGSLITAKLEAKGFTVLAWMQLGALHVTNSKRPLRTVDDFKGLNIRVLPNATHLATFQALGARPVAMDLKDVDLALRQGDIDGEEQDHDTTYSRKFYETQKYVADTGHFLDFHILVVNRKAFASLDPMQQKAIRQAAAIAAVQQRKISDEQAATALARLQELGMQFDPLSAETRVALRRATAGVVDDVKKWVGADVVNQVLAANRLPVADNRRR
jgi:TRAP-type transport system periplasmic protein